MQDVERIWHLMAKKLSDEATSEELEELRVLLLKYPETSFTLQIMTDLWKKGLEPDDTATEDAWMRHLQRMALHRPEPEPVIVEVPRRKSRKAWRSGNSKLKAFSNYLSGNGMVSNYFKI